VAAPQQVTVVRAGWVVDVETGRVAAGRAIVIRGERIEAVRPARQAAQRAAWFIDLTGPTVLPGLIDRHTRLIGGVTRADPLAPLGRSAAEDYRDGVRAARATLLDRKADLIKVIARPLRRPDRDSRWPLGRPDRVLADPVRQEGRRRGAG
jgi:imidazolonepropionase-like amidohydrolase